MLQRGDAVPHFEVSAPDGTAFRYSSIWQRKNLLLVVLPAIDPDSTAYISEVRARVAALADQDLECIITRDPVPGVSGPAVVVADRWGEIAYSVAVPVVAELPAPGELLEWVAYLNHRCPECEGEAR